VVVGPLDAHQFLGAPGGTDDPIHLLGCRITLALVVIGLPIVIILAGGVALAVGVVPAPVTVIAVVVEEVGA
jgi:hypothetical protein